MTERVRQLMDFLQSMVGKKGKAMMLLELENGEMTNEAGAMKLVKKFKNGNVLLKPLKADDDDINERKNLADNIVKLVKDDLKSQVNEMVAGALQHRRKDELKKLKQEIQKAIKEGKQKVKLSGSRGCVYLSVGDNDILL